VLVLWLVVAIGITYLAGAAGDHYSEGGSLAGTDSQAAYDLFRAEFPGSTGDDATIVFHSDHGVAADRTAIEAYLDQVRGTGGIAGASSPFDPGNVSADGDTAYSTLQFAADGLDDQLAADDVLAEATDLRASGTQVEFLGDWFVEGGVPSSEAFGLLAAVVILLIAFGSVVAMGLPLVTAVIGIMTGLAGVGLWSHVITTPDFTLQVASMVGIGVGIDYALFIVTRYRRSRQLGMSGEVAIMDAYATAGRAVAFAGCTVMVSLLGMFLMGLPFLYGLAVGTSSAVLVAVLAALTLLPALLGFAGDKLDRFSIHRGGRHTDRETGWHRWSRFVQRHPKRFALGGLIVLLAAAAPVLAMRLATADEGNNPVGSTSREAYDLLADGFGPGTNGPLLILTAIDGGGADSAALSSLVDAVAATDGVASVRPAVLSESGTAALITLIPTSSPQAEATERLVAKLRHDVIPASGLDAHVGGKTASDVDFATKMSDRLPVFIGAVLLLSFLLLMAVFRSVLVPLKAVVMNLLSIGGAYGVMVMVFQWGWLGSLIGVHGGAPIEPWAPMMLFAIVFGLSMDYEVFLLSAVREGYAETRNNSRAVVEGLASTARVITAAAAIMVCVFGSFIVGDLRSIKLIGLGLSMAVLIDATIVRMVLVPATMELLGERNWWMPRWLDRIVPRLSVERAPGVPTHPSMPDPELVEAT